MESFLAEGASERSALFSVLDDGQISTRRGCSCEVHGNELEISGDEANPEGVKGGISVNKSQTQRNGRVSRLHSMAFQGR
jgi:hypothetical protein